MLKNIRKIAVLITGCFLFIAVLTGCSEEPKTENPEQYLKNDAVLGLKKAYAEDFTRLTIIRGGLYKFVVNEDNPQHLGTAIGAVEATIFPEEYEFVRFQRLENMSAEMRKQIISQPLLDITLNKREVLNHIYNAVLKPLSAEVTAGNPLSSQSLGSLNSLIQILDDLVSNYAVLSDEKIDFKSNEAQRSFISIQNSLRELQKLELVREKD